MRANFIEGNPGLKWTQITAHNLAETAIPPNRRMESLKGIESEDPLGVQEWAVELVGIDDVVEKPILDIGHSIQSEVG